MSNVAVRTIGDGVKTEERCLQEAKELMPDLSNQGQKDIWMRVCAELIKNNRMKPLFVDSLKYYCYTLYRMNKITDFLEDEENGYTYVVDGRNGEQIKNRPEMAERNELFRQWKSLVTDFGLSPTTEKSYVNGAGAQGELFGAGSTDQSGWANFPES